MTGLLIAGVGAQLYGSYKASQAAKKASAQQAASADKALDVQRQMYQQTRGDLAPYRQYGAGALAAGHQLMGLPTPAAEAPPVLTPLSQVGQPASGGGGFVGGLGAAVGGLLPGGGNANSPLALAAQREQQVRGGMVLLRAPTGQTKAVPADQVDYYLARGATRG